MAARLTTPAMVNHEVQLDIMVELGVAEAMDASGIAAREAKAELDEKLQGLLDQGKGMLTQAEDLIRSKPLASFGVAFAAGYLVAALTRRK